MTGPQAGVGALILLTGGIALATIPLRAAIPTFALLAAIGIVGWRRFKRRLLARSRILVELSAVSDRRFEQAIQDIFRELHYAEIRSPHWTSRSEMQFRCRDRANRSVLVRCERSALTSRTTSREIKRFVRHPEHHEADRRIFLTISYSTRRAREIARERHVHLIDGETLAQLIVDIRRYRETGHAIPFWDRFKL